MKTFTITMNDGKVCHSKADSFDFFFGGEVLMTIVETSEPPTNIVDKFLLCDVCSITSEEV